MKHWMYVIIACLTILCGISCYTDAPALTGTFTCKVLDGKPLVPGSTITMIVSENKVHGNGGCNDYFASFKQRGTTISVGIITSSTMECPKPAAVLQQEASFIQLLSQAQEIGKKGNTVELMRDAKVLMTFTPMH